jgi:hypothetical protein
VIAHHGHEVRFDNGIAAALLALDLNPVMPLGRLRRCIAGEVVTHMLILVRQEADTAVIAPRNVDDHVPFSGHYAASTGFQVSTPVHFSN